MQLTISLHVMECIKMYYILASLLIVTMKGSEGNDIMFQGREPKVVLLGSNVTYRWSYTGNKKLDITEFRVLEGSNKQRLMYYPFGIGAEPQSFDNVISKYASTVEWAGDIAGKQFAYTLVNVTEFSHKKNFSLKLVDEDLAVQNGFTKELLFISVPPQIKLYIDKKNVSVKERVTIECRTIKHGRPPAEISWKHNNSLVSGKNGQYLFNQQDVGLEDAGSYQCVAKNIVAEDKSELIKLTVRDTTDGTKEEPRANPSSDGLGAGAIVGIVIAVLIVVVFVVVLVFVLKKNSSPKASGTPTANDQDESKSAMVSKTSEKDQVWL